MIQPVVENTGDIRMRQANNISENLYLIPGDFDLSMYEDRLE